MASTTRRESRLRRIIRSPVTWWLVAFLGVVVTMIASVLMVLIPADVRVAAEDTFGLLRTRFLLAAGLGLLILGAGGYLWTRRFGRS